MGSQHLHCVLQLSRTPVLGVPVLSSGPSRLGMHMVHLYTQAKTHTHKINPKEDYIHFLILMGKFLQLLQYISTFFLLVKNMFLDCYNCSWIIILASSFLTS